MNLPRVQFTVNGAMVVVALVAVLLGAFRADFVAGVGILMIAACLGLLIQDRH